MVVFEQNWLYSGKSCIRARLLYLGKSGFIRAIRLYLGKIGCIRAKWLYSGKIGSIRANIVLFRQK